jgi:hypothetical protein
MAEKRKRAPWQVTGSKVEGYWAFWPLHGGEFSRRFEDEQSATNWLPVKSGNKGRKLPLGEKRIYRVVWSYDEYRWSFDIVRVFTQEEVDEQFMQMVAEVAAQ